jgi:hypothetical protein
MPQAILHFGEFRSHCFPVHVSSPSPPHPLPSALGRASETELSYLLGRKASTAPSCVRGSALRDCHVVQEGWGGVSELSWEHTPHPTAPLSCTPGPGQTSSKSDLAHLELAILLYPVHHLAHLCPQAPSLPTTRMAVIARRVLDTCLPTHQHEELQREELTCLCFIRLLNSVTPHLSSLRDNSATIPVVIGIRLCFTSIAQRIKPHLYHPGPAAAALPALGLTVRVGDLDIRRSPPDWAGMPCADWSMCG